VACGDFTLTGLACRAGWRLDVDYLFCERSRRCAVDESNGVISRRRALLAAGIGGVSILSGAVLGGAVPAAAQSPVVPRASRRRAIGFLDAMMDAYPGSGELRLPQSYSDQVGLFATAFSYDAALAVLAYLADERAESDDRARLIGQSLIYAQQHDPQFSDGRIRQAYNVGPYVRGGVEEPYGLVLPSGTVNVGGAYGFLGSGTGECAWVGLALCALHRRTADGRAIGGALRLGEWIMNNCRSPGPLGGFSAGFDRRGDRMGWVSTGQNADLSALFGELTALTGERSWLRQRDEAARFVASMWDPVAQRFHSGSVDGITVERTAVLLESQTHSWLALGDLDQAGCLDVADRQLTVTDHPDRPNSALTGEQTFTGVTVSSQSRTVDPDTPIEPGLPAPDPDAVWLEGTAQYAIALHHSALGALEYYRRMQTLLAAQVTLGEGQTVAGQPLPADGALLAATSPLHAGYVDSGYFPVAHVAATAWYVLATTGTNPLRQGGEIRPVAARR
jgi:hypothetical protein